MGAAPNTTPSASAGISLAKRNIAAARTKSLIDNLIESSNSSTFAQTSQAQKSTLAEDDDQDFRACNELAGLGSAARFQDDGDDSTVDSILRRPAASTNDLLEKLIGKRAAQARKKAQRPAARSVLTVMGVSQEQTSKPSKVELKGKDDVEEEESGRASAFSTRRGERSHIPPKVEDEESNGKTDANADEAARQVCTKAGASTGVETRKRKVPGSYLDELLAGGKKKKGKKHKAHG